MSDKLVRNIRTAVIVYCLDNGISSPNKIRKILKDVRHGVGNMSIAGVKAADTKGQNLCYIET